MKYFDCPEHPVVRNMEKTGYPDGNEPGYPRCPVCGEEADRLYFSSHLKEYVGCENCLTGRDAWDTVGD